LELKNRRRNSCDSYDKTTKHYKKKQKNFSTNWTPKIHVTNTKHKFGGGQIHEIGWLRQPAIITHMDGWL
jgi:hypothetical protein